MKINLPDNVKYIIDSYEACGYEAYAVGGCVRDSLLGKIPNDWDICTNALPEETKAVFSDAKIIETGIKHGTLTLILEHTPYEITTFRTEKGYSDSRRPDSVEFVKSIKEDLERRDFTVNAMAYNEKCGLIDLYGGAEDLEKGIIRCVGNSYERFSDDALRIMRAIRFAAVLGFEIDEDTEKSIHSLKSYLKNIAVERINVEFTKTLMSDNCYLLYEYQDVIGEFFNNALKIDEKICMALSYLEKNKIYRLAALYSALYEMNDENINMITNSLLYMRYESKTVKSVISIISCIDIGAPKSLCSCRMLAFEYGIDSVLGAFKINEAFCRATGTSCKEAEQAIGFAEKIKAEGLCTKISELDINGSDLHKLGIGKGPDVGRILKELLFFVFEGRIENKKDELLNAAKLFISDADNDS